VTILAGFSATRHSDAPLNLALQIAGRTGESVVAAAVVERSWVSPRHRVDREYGDYLAAQAKRSLEQVVARLSGHPDVVTVVHQSDSIPTGLIELSAQHDASLVVVGSSSSGLLGRVTLGSVTDRLVHTAEVAVALAPRSYPSAPGPLRRITAAYGAAADINGLLPQAAELAQDWKVALRIVSFTVRPTLAFTAALTTSAEELIVREWSRRTQEEVSGQLDEMRSVVTVSDVEVVVGAGQDWREAVEAVPWVPGDLLALGSGAAGQSARVFLGSAASKILRHSPVPILLVPRLRLEPP
jgi:nucleotide-binding universal stress UspA family protein